MHLTVGYIVIIKVTKWVDTFVSGYIMVTMAVVQAVHHLGVHMSYISSEAETLLI